MATNSIVTIEDIRKAYSENKMTMDKLLGMALMEAKKGEKSMIVCRLDDAPAMDLVKRKFIVEFSKDILGKQITIISW